jgi:hypothetical protein
MEGILLGAWKLVSYQSDDSTGLPWILIPASG